MKGLVSTTIDKVRVSYGATTESKPRRFVMGATANVSEMFSFDDEQRRFWTIEVKPTTSCGCLDIQWLRDNRDRIWATSTRKFLNEDKASFTLNAEM